MGVCFGRVVLSRHRYLDIFCVHIHWLGNGYLGFRPYGGSLSKSAKVTKALLPHHSVPRLGSACP